MVRGVNGEWVRIDNEQSQWHGHVGLVTGKNSGFIKVHLTVSEWAWFRFVDLVPVEAKSPPSWQEACQQAEVEHIARGDDRPAANGEAFHRWMWQYMMERNLVREGA